MAATAGNFSSLPPELRSQIWLDALPDRDEPALFFYQKGVWCPRYLSQSDEGYYAEDPDNLRLEFRHDLLDYVEVKTPLIFVNRESRSIALGWHREQGHEKRFCKNRQCQVFARSFDPTRDTLYVALDMWREFCEEPAMRPFEPDMIEKIVTTGSDIQRIAVPEAIFFGEADTLAEMFEFLRPAVLFIIIGSQPRNLRLKEENVVHGRWELEGKQGAAFTCNNDRRVFEMEPGGHSGDESLYRRVEEASKGIAEWFVSWMINPPSLEIQSVFAAGR